MVNVSKLHRLSCLLAAPTMLGANSNPPPDLGGDLHRTGILLTQVKQAVTTSLEQRPLRNDNHRKAREDVVAMIGSIEKSAHATRARRGAEGHVDAISIDDHSLCDGPAQVFLSTGMTLTNGGAGSVAIELRADDGGQQFTFASGTTMANILLTINHFTAATGVEGAVVPDAPDRIVLFTAKSGPDQFIRVRQLFGKWPILFEQPDEQVGHWFILDFGGDGAPGDLNCDGVVNTDDLLALLRRLGRCRGCPEDLNDSGRVDVADLILILHHWGIRGQPRGRRR